MKKKIILTFIILFSIAFSIFANSNITNNSEFVLQILYTLLGLCITAYVFICSPVSDIVKENKSLYKSASKLVTELESNMKLIFYLSIIIIFTSILKNINIPFVIDPKNIDFNLFVIKSPKELIINSVISISFFLSLYAFYDFIQASFLIVKGTLLNQNK